MKLHDLQPAPGSRQPRTRVGRGIAAGKGKTAGRGTKGQKSRTGGSIAPWFEGGQTPIQIRIPKLRGFRNRFRVAYEVVNVGRLEAAAEEGRFAEAQAALAQADEAAVARRGKRSDAPLTVTADLLHASGLIGSLKRPLKVLGAGELTRPVVRRGRRVQRDGPQQDRGRRRHRPAARAADRSAGGADRRRGACGARSDRARCGAQGCRAEGGEAGPGREGGPGGQARSCGQACAGAKAAPAPKAAAAPKAAPAPKSAPAAKATRPRRPPADPAPAGE